MHNCDFSQCNNIMGCHFFSYTSWYILGRLREEQKQLLLSERGALSYDALQRDMPLLDATVRESTRLLPSAHTVFRRAQASGPPTRNDLTPTPPFTHK